MQSEFVKRNKHILVSDISALGGNIFYVILMIFFFLRQDYGIFTDLLTALAIILFVSIVIRILFFKERPNKYSYTSIIEKIDAASLPSLHASRISFLGIYFVNFFNNIQLTGLLVFLVLLVCYSRLYLNKHDVKDLGAGIFLGIIVYYLIGILN